MKARPKTMVSEVRKARAEPQHLPLAVLAQTEPTISVDGNLDVVDPDGVIEGWCWSPDQPGLRRLVAILVDGIEVARAICDETRPDLLSAGVGDGAHAFLVVLPSEQRKSGQSATITLRDVATGKTLGENAAITWRDLDEGQIEPGPSPMLLQGHLDGVTKDGRISGWCWYPGTPDAHVSLHVLVDDTIVGTITVASFRPDLKQAGIGDGTHAFSYALPWSVLADKGTITISVRDTQTGLSFSPPILLRLGRLASAEDRVAELERQIRLMRQQIEELEQELASRTDERPTQDMFATLGSLFMDLAKPSLGQNSAGALAAWHGAAFAHDHGSNPATLLSRAIETLKARHQPFSLSIPTTPSATIAITATADIATLYRCLRALRDTGADQRADIVVIDDGSAASEAALLPSLVRHVHVQQRPAGSDLASQLNELARSARSPLFGYLDPTVTISDGWLEALIESFDLDATAGLVSSRLVGTDGLLRHAGLFVGANGLPQPLGHLESAALPEHSFLRALDAAGPAGFLIRQEALTAVGGFASGYAGMASIIIDLSQRLRRAGHTVLLQPSAHSLIAEDQDIAHLLPETSEQSEDTRRLRHHWFGAVNAAPQLAPVCFAGHALVIDNDIPQPDRDAGSVTALEQMQLLRRLGYRVTFAPTGNDNIPDRAAQTLRGLGIELACAPHYAGATDYLTRHGATLSLVHVYRHMNATMLRDRIRALAPQAKLIFSPADLHHLRESRHAAISGLGGAPGRQQETREQELLCVREADVTILNSDFEMDLIQPEVVPAKLRLLRWIVRPRPSTRPFAARSGICFIGNFRHSPNVDGMRWFVESVMPRLRAERAGITLHIAGSDITPEISALAGPDIVLHGWVADLTDLFGRVRLSVAPLRFGAGFKGKIATSLAYGVPVIGSPIALEGTGLKTGHAVAVADTAEQFTAEILHLHNDATLWQAQSAAALERCRSLYAPEAALGVYRDLLHDLGLPVPTGEHWCAPPAHEPSCFSR